MQIHPKQEEKTTPCPKCGRDNVRPVPFVYETGTTATGGLGFGVGLANQQLVPCLAGMTSKSQSLFVKRLAPPKRYTPHPGLLLFPFRDIVGIVAMLVVAIVTIEIGWIGLLLAPISLGIAIRLTILGYRTRAITRQRYYDLDRGYAEDYEAALSLWRRSQVCLDCGQVFDN